MRALYFFLLICLLMALGIATVVASVCTVLDFSVLKAFVSVQLLCATLFTTDVLVREIDR